VQRAKADGECVVVGDGAGMSILEHAGLQKAHALIVAINDPEATKHIVAQARRRRGDLFILARTRYLQQIDDLYHLGATKVIPEDFETSIEIMAHVLREMDVPDNLIEAQLTAVRAGGYSMLRGKATDRAAQDDLIAALQRTTMRTHLIEGASFACNKTLAELNLRAATGTTIIAITRGGTPQTNPGAHESLREGDVLVMFGAHAQLEEAKALLIEGPGAMRARSGGKAEAEQRASAGGSEPGSEDRPQDEDRS